MMVVRAGSCRPYYCRQAHQSHMTSIVSFASEEGKYLDSLLLLMWLLVPLLVALTPHCRDRLSPRPIKAVPVTLTPFVLQQRRRVITRVARIKEQGLAVKRITTPNNCDTSLRRFLLSICHVTGMGKKSRHPSVPTFIVEVPWYNAMRSDLPEPVGPIAGSDGADTSGN